MRHRDRVRVGCKLPGRIDVQLHARALGVQFGHRAREHLERFALETTIHRTGVGDDRNAVRLGPPGLCGVLHEVRTTVVRRHMTMAGNVSQPGCEARRIAGADEGAPRRPRELLANSPGPQTSPATGLLAFDGHPVVHVQNDHRHVVSFGSEHRQTKISIRQPGEVHDLRLEPATLDLLLNERQILPDELFGEATTEERSGPLSCRAIQ